MAPGSDGLIESTLPIFSQKLDFHVKESWKVGAFVEKGSTFILEMVPPGEDVPNWTEIFTITGMKNAVKNAPTEIYATVQALVKDSCPQDYISQSVPAPAVQNYKTFAGISGCKKSPTTKGRNEISFYLIIQGKKDSYLIKKSFRESLTDPSQLHLNADNYKSLAPEVLSIRLCKNNGRGPSCITENK